MQIKGINIIERVLRAACFLFLAVSIVGFLGSGSCHAGCGHDDDDHFFEDDDDDHGCGHHHDDDDDHHNSSNDGGPGDSGAVFSTGLSQSVDLQSQFDTRGTPALVRSIVAVSRLANSSVPRLATFMPIRADSDSPLELEALLGVQGMGLFGLAALGPIGSELTEEELIDFAELFLIANEDLLGLPDERGPWKLDGIQSEGTNTLIAFKSALLLEREESVVTSLIFDGFGVLTSVHHQLNE